MQNAADESHINLRWKDWKLPEVDFNLAVVQSVPGACKVAQLVLGLICFSVISRFCQYYHPLTGSSLGFFCSHSATFFLLVSSSCFFTSALLLLCCLFSYFTASFLPKTSFDCSYHGLACFFYFCASVALLVTVVSVNEEKGVDKEPNYDAKIAAAVLGLINCVLYGASTFFSLQFQRQLEQG